MRTVLLADSWVGWQVARFLREVNENIAGLVVHPETDRRSGEKIIEAAGLSKDHVLASATLHDREHFRILEGWEPDIIVAAWYGHILKAPVLSLPPRGCINLHPSYLPYHRGKFPNVWSIIEGTAAGVTIHYMDEGVDTGDVIVRRELRIEPTDTGQTLHRKLERACVTLFRETWPQIRSGTAPRSSQSTLPETPCLHRASDVQGIDKIELDRSYEAAYLINLLRARTFPPHPSAYFEVEGRRVSIRVELTEEPRTSPEASAP